MHAMIATFLGLPASTRRLKKDFITELQRIAVSVLMYKTERRLALPPHTILLPVKRPLSLLNGATPAKATICSGTLMTILSCW